MSNPGVSWINIQHPTFRSPVVKITDSLYAVLTYSLAVSPKPRHGEGALRRRSTTRVVGGS